MAGSNVKMPCGNFARSFFVYGRKPLESTTVDRSSTLQVTAMFRIILYLTIVGCILAKSRFEFTPHDQHEDIIVEYGQAVTLECNTYDTEYHYVEWYRNDSRIAVIQQLEDYKPVVSTNYTDRAELRKKDLHIKHVKFEDAASYVCRIAVRKEEKQVSVQHGTFWKLIVKHEEL